MPILTAGDRVVIVNKTANIPALGSIPGLGRSPGEGKATQYSGLENSMDYIVHGLAKSQKQLSGFHFYNGASILVRRDSSVQFSCSVMSNYLRPHEPQHARPPCPSPTPGVYSNSCPLSQWCHPTISSPLSPSPPALNLSQHQGLFNWVSSSHWVAKILEFQLQHQSFQ